MGSGLETFLRTLRRRGLNLVGIVATANATALRVRPGADHLTEEGPRLLITQPDQLTP